MRVLLDTHVLLWTQGDPRKLDRAVIALLNRSPVFVSAASIWEISVKAAIGKLKLTPRSVITAIEQAGFQLLPVNAEHAARVYDLDVAHSDPFDRLLVAQAQVESMTLLTRDASLAVFGDSVRVV